MGPRIGLGSALLRSLRLICPPKLSPSRLSAIRNYGGAKYSGKHRIHSSEFIVGGSIALCTGMFLYSEHAKTEATGPKEYGRLISSRPPSSWEIYRENFILSRKNVEEGRWWTLVTHTFAHSSPLHLVINMMALWSIGRPFVLIYGPVTFVWVWLAAGVGGGYLSLQWQSIIDSAVDEKLMGKAFGSLKDSQQWTREAVGASGSILGMLGVLTCTFPRLYLLQTLTITGFSALCVACDALPQIGHIAHLGGIGTGAAWWLLFIRR